MIPNLPDLLTIPKTKRTTIPQKFIFIDTETEKIGMGGVMVKHVLKTGHAVYWQRAKGKRAEVIEDYAFNNALDFWTWATGKANKRETVYTFAHNATFDFLVLDGFRLLPCVDFTLQSLYYKFTTAVLRFSDGSRRLVFVDSMNYFPVSLEKLGESIGHKKAKVDFENVDPQVLRDYCKNDAHIVFEAVRGLVNAVADQALGSFRTTAPSMAHSIYRHSFMKHDIVTCHVPEVVTFEKEAYFGGVVAVNKLIGSGSPELFKLDVNSMYPSVMADELFPTRIQEFMTDVPLKLFEQFLRSYHCVARVRLNATEPIYPVRNPSGNFYPVGDFVTTTTTPLLKRAMERGEVIEVQQLAVYQRKPIFKDYVNYMMEQRHAAQESGNRALELFFKTMNNSLYGKFGQSVTETKTVGECPPSEFAVYDAFDPVKSEYWRELHAGGSVIFIYDRGEARYTSYAIAAHVTDFARLKLFDFASVAGWENVYYMDTDSLIVNASGKSRLAGYVHPSDLGMLKVEDKGRVFVGFSKKDYILGKSRKMKGYNVDGMRDEGHIFKTFQNVRFYGAARHDLSGGAFWQETYKRYNPY